jgi:hypothetical protein
MTFRERIRGACHWYLEIPEEAITKKKDTCAGIHKRRHLFILSMKIGRSLVAEKLNKNSLNPARANRGDEAAQELHLPRARWL